MVRNVFTTADALTEHWSPVAVAEANGQLVKIAKIKGEFVWHNHADEDEIFLVIKGVLTIRYRDRPDVVLNEGDIHTVPKGVEHCPVCEEEVVTLLFEPAATAHTGNVTTDITKSIEAQRASLELS
ncbi:MAG: cupin domain-containing protein [Pseudomonadota bacterium]